MKRLCNAVVWLLLMLVHIAISLIGIASVALVAALVIVISVPVCFHSSNKQRRSWWSQFKTLPAKKELDLGDGFSLVELDK